MSERLEGAWLWVAVVLASIAGALLFGFQRAWVGFILFAVSTALASLQLVRILMRSRTRGAGGRRW